MWLLVVSRLQGGEQVFTSLIEQTNKMGLEINLEKKNYDSVTKALE
jgi:hypothetical protein